MSYFKELSCIPNLRPRECAQIVRRSCSVLRQYQLLHPFIFTRKQVHHVYVISSVRNFPRSGPNRFIVFHTHLIRIRPKLKQKLCDRKVVLFACSVQRRSTRETSSKAIRFWILPEYVVDRCSMLGEHSYQHKIGRLSVYRAVHELTFCKVSGLLEK